MAHPAPMGNLISLDARRDPKSGLYMTEREAAALRGYIKFRHHRQRLLEAAGLATAAPLRATPETPHSPAKLKVVPSVAK